MLNKHILVNNNNYKLKSPNSNMEKKRQEEIFLEAKNFFNAEKKEIRKLAKAGERVIHLPFSKLVGFSPMLADLVIDAPEETLAILENALEELELAKAPRVRFLDLPSSAGEKIRNIRAKHLDQFISVEGIVRQASDVKPQVVNARFECPSCGAILSVLQVDRKFREPSRCSCNWKGNFKLLSKEMVDVQRIILEESPDSLEGGEQPRRINIFLKEDLVDPRMEKHVTPGSRIKIHGILKEVPVPLQTGISTRFDIALEANNVISLEESFEELDITEEDIKEILELAADLNIFKRLAQSIAPSIYGFNQIKEAILLQLFGGVKKTKSDGGQTRGDTHILLVGDPGVAKSAMLQYISIIAPKGRYVSGKAATGVGLTASVTRDEFLRGWALEAGAMVLANKGIVMIDEIEKMNEHDRSTMHQAMEQQNITIAKANIYATLHAETSVLAAGNPKLGRFDPYTPIPQQIDISPALLSRFDIIFIIRDLPNKIQDEAIASHVLEEHKQEVIHDVIEPKLFRKYVAYAKQKIKPKLTDEAIKEIRDFYVKLRNQSVRTDTDIKPIPITPRQLEGIVRLAEAHAKLHLREKVTREDAKKAIELLKTSLSQVGYDEETQSFDIDRITTGITSSKRGKILLVREVISQLESKLGKLIPMEELENALQDNLSKTELEEAIEQLIKAGDVFKPKRGFIQKI